MSETMIGDTLRSMGLANELRLQSQGSRKQIDIHVAWLLLVGVGLTACSPPSIQSDFRTRGSHAADSGSHVGGAAGRVSSALAGDALDTPPDLIRVQAGVQAAEPSGGRGGAPASCAAFSEQVKNQRKPADIIFAVDNSGSMGDEIGFVRERLNAFSQQLVASGIDVRIILLSRALEERIGIGNGICIAAPLGSGACPEDSKAPGYLHVPVKVGSHDALNIIIETYPTWREQLRPNASKTFVVVSDDDARDRPNDSVVAFQQSVAGLDGGLFASWSFSGIFCFSDCPDSATVGTVYRDLVTLTKGVSGDLCEQNFAPVFEALAKAVIESSQLDCAWSIPAPPAGQVFDRQQVNVQYTANGAAPASLLRVSDVAACGARGGWYYDSETDPKQIVACAATCDALQADLMPKVDVLFGCQSMLAPY